jgi:histidinol-phosphate aminotransferase
MTDHQTRRARIDRLQRFRIAEERDYSRTKLFLGQAPGCQLFLNRAERVEPWPLEIIETMKRDIDFSRIGFYPDLDPLYNKITRHFSIPVSQLLLTNGADGAIRLVLDLASNQDGPIAFPTPSYGMYQVYCEIFGLRSLPLTYGSDWRLEKSKLYDNIDTISVLFLPRPAHIETNWRTEELLEIAARLASHKGTLVIDETYFGFGAESMLGLINNNSNIFVVRSFSKTFGLPGIRVGCLLGNAEVMRMFQNNRPPYEISFLSQGVCEFFLDNMHLIESYAKRIQQGRDHIRKECKKNGLLFLGSEGYFANIILPSEEVASCVQKNLIKAGIFVKNQGNLLSFTLAPPEYMSLVMEKVLMCHETCKH